MSADHYLTLATHAEVRHRIDRSEFLGIAFPIAGEAAFFDDLARIEKQYFDGTHHCWALRLFADNRARSSDAGEPSGTAGKPILAAIEGAELHDVAVVVVRWYGGIKLGTGGLSRAYRDTAAQTLQSATVVDRYIYERVRVLVPFDSLGHVYRLIDPPNVLLAEERYGGENEFFFDVRQSLAGQFTKRLTELRLTFTLP